MRLHAILPLFMQCHLIFRSLTLQFLFGLHFHKLSFITLLFFNNKNTICILTNISNHNIKLQILINKSDAQNHCILITVMQGFFSSFDKKYITGNHLELILKVFSEDHMQLESLNKVGCYMYCMFDNSRTITYLYGSHTSRWSLYPQQTGNWPCYQQWLL